MLSTLKMKTLPSYTFLFTVRLIIGQNFGPVISVSKETRYVNYFSNYFLCFSYSLKKIEVEFVSWQAAISAEHKMIVLGSGCVTLVG